MRVRNGQVVWGGGSCCVINLAGNVGIGTASRTAKLEVNGEVIIANRAYGMAYRTTEYPSPVANQWFDVPLDANSNLVNVVHSTTVNPARVTVNVAGTYLIHYYVLIDSLIGNVGRSRLYKNSVSEILGSQGWVDTQDTDSSSNQVITSLSANDYITLQVYVGSVERDADAVTLTIVKIGS